MCQWGANRNPWGGGLQMSSFPAPTYPQTNVSQIGDHRLSTSWRDVEQPDHHCGDDLVCLLLGHSYRHKCEHRMQYGVVVKTPHLQPDNLGSILWATNGQQKCYPFIDRGGMNGFLQPSAVDKLVAFAVEDCECKWVRLYDGWCVAYAARAIPTCWFLADDLRSRLVSIKMLVSVYIFKISIGSQQNIAESYINVYMTNIA